MELTVMILEMRLVDSKFEQHIATSKAENMGIPPRSNSASFIKMNELPQTKPKARRASHMAAFDVRMKMQN